MMKKQSCPQASKLLLSASFGIAAACGGGDARRDGDRGANASSPSQTGTGPGAAAASEGPATVALGDSIFHGLMGGTCYTCHGADAEGTQLAPDLTDARWLHGDGSEQFLVQIITNGVMTPKEYSSVMPPKGGAPLTDEQVRAVAMYVDSLGGGR